MRNLFRDRAYLESLVSIGMSANDIAEQCDCHVMTVHRAIDKFGIAYDKAGRQRERIRIERHKRFPQLSSREWLFNEYHGNVKTLKEVAETIGNGCTIDMVLGAFKRLGIESRIPRNTPDRQKRCGKAWGLKARFPKLYEKEWLQQKYVTEDKSLEEIANEISKETPCSITAVKKAMTILGIPRRHKTRKGVIRSDSNPMLADAEWLRVEYIEKNRSAKDIAAEAGCTDWAVHRALRRNGFIKEPEKQTKKHGKRIDGESFVIRDGYVYIYSPNHPFNNRNGHVAKHRLVVEKEIGRYLTDIEEIHHLNLNRSDNRLENLMLMPDHGAHSDFHHNPPDWIPRCPHCNKPWPESLTGRPDNVPLIYERPV